MTADGFQPPSYYQPRNSPPTAVVALIALATVVVTITVLAFLFGLGPFAPSTATPVPTGGPPTIEPTAGQPTPTAGPSTAGAPTPTIGTSPSVGPSPTVGPSPSDALGRLLVHVPETIRPTCTETAAENAVVVAVDCQAGDGVTVTYAQYPDAAAMNDEYDDRFAAVQIDRDSGNCLVANDDGTSAATPDRWPSEHVYSVAGTPVGRYLCQSDDRASIIWTDQRFNILSVAVSTDGGLNRLVTFWVADAGPVE